MTIGRNIPLRTAGIGALIIAFVTLASAQSVVFGPNVLISNGPTSPGWNEPAMAVNPLNVKNRVAVFGGSLVVNGLPSCFPSTTTDGGETWQVGGALPLLGNSCDIPSIAADATGTFYISYRDINFNSTKNDVNFDVVKSSDGGATFSGFAVAVPTGHGANELYVRTGHLGVDTNSSSPFRGSIYAAVDSFSDAGVALIAMSVSQNGGATWSKPLVVDGPFTSGTIVLANPLPVIAPDGTAYLFYSRFDFTSLNIQFVKSTNGGMTWSVPAFVASGISSPGRFLMKNADPQYGITGSRGLLGFSYPAAAATPDGSLFVAWTDVAGGTCNFSLGGLPACSDANVRLSVSHDGGASWSGPVKVSDDVGTADQFNPGLVVHRDGKVSLTWYDRRLDPNNINYDIFYTFTADGLGFLPNVKVTDQSGWAQVGREQFLSQWNGPGVYRDQVFPVWVDSRTGVHTIFTSSAEIGN